MSKKIPWWDAMFGRYDGKIDKNGDLKLFEKDGTPVSEPEYTLEQLYSFIKHENK